MAGESRKVDFFISYAGADRAWAEWIAWTLERNGYTTILQAWDFRPDGSFVEDMQRAATKVERTLAVLSSAYLSSPSAEAEWRTAFTGDSPSKPGSLLPVRIEDVRPRGLIADITHIDLVGVDEETAKMRLLEGVKRSRFKPSHAPGSPYRVHPSYPAREERSTRRDSSAYRRADPPQIPKFVDTHTIFIVHGHDEARKEAVARLLERCVLDAQVVILHEQPNSGRLIIEKFEDYAATASYAVILMTGDDRGSERGKGQYRSRARQNVVLELGFFIGKLGRDRVAVLHGDGVEVPSDILGIGYIPIDASGGWRLSLAQEVDAAGLPVDFRKVR